MKQEISSKQFGEAPPSAVRQGGENVTVTYYEPI
jgi:hypothetical protein